jgi:hypothetical protein
VVDLLRQRLDTLLAVEEILGAVLFDAAGRVEATAHLDPRDAAALFTVLSSAVDRAAASTDTVAAFAAFMLSEGQVAICADDWRTIIALTDPGLDALLLKSVLVELLAALAASPVTVDAVGSTRVSPNS